MVTEPKYPVETVNTALDIIELLRERDRASLTEVATELDLSKSTAHRHLKTLEYRQYIVREVDKYCLSHQFLELGKYTQARKDEFELIREKVKEIAEQTNERAQFMVKEHGQVVYVFRSSGKHGVKTDPGIGKYVPIHATAAGKAILASLSDEAVTAHLDDHPLETVTDRTITEKQALFDELDTIRERGYSINDQERTGGLRAIGTAVHDADDRVLGAISVSGPSHRMTGDRFEEELPNYLLGTVNELELNIAHQ